MANDCGIHGEANIASKSKQWTRELQLEFVQLLKKNENKNRAAKEFELCCKVELNLHLLGT